MRLTSLFLIFFIISSLCIAQNNNCEIIEYDTKIVFNGDNIESTYSYTIQINNSAGTKHAEISIPYSEKNKIKNLDASIQDIFGNEIRRLKKREIEITTPWQSFEFHTDERLLAFKLIHNRFPYIVKYSYSTTENNYISLVRWAPVLNYDLNIKKAQISLETPDNFSINIYQQKLDSAQVVTTNGTTKYTWKKENYKAPEKESFSPPRKEIIPLLIVMPKEFSYGVKGKGTTWEEFGNWTCRLNEGLDQLSSDEILKVHALTDSIIHDTGKIKALYHYLQDNTRYIYVGMDIGGLQPHPATYVCNNRYGDCKALSNYMKALLKEVGIESFYTTIYAGDKPVKIKKEIPTAQFNHVILCVPQPNDTIWLECTDKTAPFNYLGTFTQNRLTLVNKPNESCLVSTPKLNISESEEKSIINIDINELGNGSFIMDGILRGAKFDHMKSFDDELSEYDQQKYIENTGLLKNADIKTFHINRVHRDSTYLTIKLEGNLTHISENIGKKTLLLPAKSISYKLTKVENRESSIMVPYTVNQKDSITYHFKKNIHQVSGDLNYELNSRFGYYQKKLVVNNDKLVIKRVFQLRQGRYPKSDYSEFYNFLNEILTLDNKKTIITY